MPREAAHLLPTYLRAPPPQARQPPARLARTTTPSSPLPRPCRPLLRPSAKIPIAPPICYAPSACSLMQKAKTSGGGGPAAAMLPSMMLQGGASVPPLSPRSLRLSRRSSAVGGGQPNRSTSPLRPATARSAKEIIPQFYFQDGRPPTVEVKQCIATIDQLFAGHSNGLRPPGY